MSGLGDSDSDDPLAAFEDLPYQDEPSPFKPDSLPLPALSSECEMDENESCEGYSRHNYKVIVIGDANSGKTSFIRRYVTGDYDSQVAATVGVDYSLKTITIRQRQMVILLQIWDIAGQDRNRTMVRPFFNDAVGAIVMADCSKLGHGFESAWKSDLDAKVTLPDGSKLPCVLVLNKCDLLGEDHDLGDQGERIMHEQGYSACILGSAKEGRNVDNAFLVLVQQLVQAHDQMLSQPQSEPESNHLTVGEFVALKQRGYVPEREQQQCGC